MLRIATIKCKIAIEETDMDKLGRTFAQAVSDIGGVTGDFEVEGVPKLKVFTNMAAEHTPRARKSELNLRRSEGMRRYWERRHQKEATKAKKTNS